MKLLYRLSSTLADSSLRSALCVVGPIASKIGRTLTPDLDPTVFKDGPKPVIENLKHRRLDEQSLFGMKTEKVIQNYDEYNSLCAQYVLLEKELQEKSQSDLLSRDAKKQLKEQKKELQRNIYTSEENYVVPMLRFPNFLDVKTPTNQDHLLIHTNDVMGKINFSLKSHQDSRDIEFEEGNPSNVFLKGHWPKTEMDLLRKAQLFLQKNEFCDLIAPPDIVRSTVIEGCDPLAFGDPTRFLSLAKSSDFGDIKSGLGAHLVGGASIPAMVSFFVKNILTKSNMLPLNLFCVGKQYRPMSSEIINTPSLYSTQQSSCVGLLSFNANQESADASFQLFQSKLQTFYDHLGLKYRLVYCSAKNLSLSESLRLEAQMWSPINKSYVTVASLSKFDDFISRRLLLKYIDDEKQLKLHHIVGGTFIDAYKVIGCMLENE